MISRELPAGGACSRNGWSPLGGHCSVPTGPRERSSKVQRSESKHGFARPAPSVATRTGYCAFLSAFIGLV